MTIKKLLLWLFKHNECFIVWSKQCSTEVTYTKNGIDTGIVESHHFQYIIYYYPYHYTRRYHLVCSPEKLTYSRLYYKISTKDHQYYQIALDKLKEFQESELIASVELPDIKGVKTNK